MHKDEPVLTRRDFVRGAVGATISGLVLGTGSACAAEHRSPPPARGPRSAKVVIVRHERAMAPSLDIDETVLRSMVDEVLMRVTGAPSGRDAWLRLVTRDDVIGLVPTPHLNPTHREVVDVVRASLVAAGIPADRIREAQGGPDLPRACTALIPLPALKAHWLTGIGTVLKNYIMYSGHPSQYHDARNATLGEIWNLPFVKGKTRIVLVDALRPLCDKGPQPDPRYMWNYNGLVAGTDPVAVDAVCLRIIMEKRQALHGEPWPLSPPPLCIEAADVEYGLGTSRSEEITIEKSGWAEGALV